MQPTVTIEADGTIFNGEYETRNGFGDYDNHPLVQTCKITMKRLGVAVLFTKDAITTFVDDEEKLRRGGYNWLDHLVQFIIYKSRVNYHVYLNHFAKEVEDFDTCTEVDRVLTFNLAKLNGEQGIKRVSDDDWIVLGANQFQLEIDRAEFDDFHKLIDNALAAAITYFLIAAENPQYFLVEYFKSMEVIKHELGGEDAMIDSLSPHGFTKGMLTTLKRDANNHRRPIAFGRHAPKQHSHVIGIDLRSLRTQSFQRTLFTTSTALCRALIDAYISYLRHRATNESI